MAPSIAALLLHVLFLALAAAQSADLAKYFKICSRSDPNIDQCIVDTLNFAREHLSNGIPELDLVPLDPQLVPLVRVEEGPGDFQVQFVIKNSTFTGQRQQTVTRARFDLANRYLEFDAVMPKMAATGRYSWGGRLLTLRLQGNGAYELELGNVNITHKIDFKEVTLGGLTHWQVERYVWDLQMEDFKANFKNLFRGNARLGNYANTFINRNWQPGYTIMKPLIAANAGYVYGNLTNAMLAKVPLSKLFS